MTVVVPVLNGQATLGDCLSALVQAEYPEERREILVVDNGSIDRSVDIARRFPVRWVLEPERGLSSARNRGIAESRSELIAFVDCDLFVTVGWLARLVEGFDDPEVFAVTGEVVAHPPRTPAERYMAWRKPLWQDWVSQARPFAWLLCGNSAFRRETFRRVGYFDAQFAGVGCEDIDFAWRFLRAGLQARQAPRAIAFHQHRVTSRALFRQNYRNGRGQAVLRRKYPGELPWGWRRELTAWSDLLRAAWQATWAASWLPGRARLADPYYPWFDFVRKSGQRLGFVRGTLRKSWRLRGQASRGVAG